MAVWGEEAENADAELQKQIDAFEQASQGVKTTAAPAKRKKQR